MTKCGEERRRLAAEWAEYFTQQKLSKERAEREAERAMHADSQREGSIISLTKVGPRACRTEHGRGPWTPSYLGTKGPGLGPKSTAKDIARVQKLDWCSAGQVTCLF